MGAPDRGSKRDITLLFDGQEITATLRRIDNEQGRVQVKYENKAGEPFRLWLATVFNATRAGSAQEYFEVSRARPDVFEITPFPAMENSAPSLSVDQWLFHRGADRLFGQDNPLAEIPAIVHAVPLDAQAGQSFYNQAFVQSFGSWSWRPECRVVQELGLKCDFAKDGVQVEVEFSNARTYYQDFIKFLLGNRYAGAELGILVVPTSSFARHLCEIGRQRALEKGRGKYSGMIDFDKVRREFHYLTWFCSITAHLDFFEAAFGRTPEEFIEIGMMPEEYNIYRRRHENEGAREWRGLFQALTDAEKLEFMRVASEPEFKVQDGKFEHLRAHYVCRHKISAVGGTKNGQTK